MDREERSDVVRVGVIYFVFPSGSVAYGLCWGFTLRTKIRMNLTFAADRPVTWRLFRMLAYD